MVANGHTIPVSVEPLVLGLIQPFRIAHGTSAERCNALVKIGDFYGEAALPPYYHSTVDDVREYVESLDFSFLSDPDGYSIDRQLEKLPPGPPAAIGAVDMALHDMWASELGVPLYRLFGLERRISAVSSFAQSIPVDETEWLETLAAVNDFPFLKLKLGSGDLHFDEEIVRMARQNFSGRLAVDANAAWTIPDAVEIIPRLAAFNLEFVEQPISYDDIDDWHLLRRLLKSHNVPLIADESVRTADDVIALAGAADGVNLKLAKCGGVRRVRTLITIARALDMSVMLGCMIESSLALTAAAHLAPLADFLDLDAMLYLSDDPFSGVVFDRGRLTLPDSPGLGAIKVG